MNGLTTAGARPVTVIGNLVARPGQEAALEQALRTVVAATRQEPGNHRYDLHGALDTPGTFLLYEGFADEEALLVHFAALHSVALAARFDELLAEPLQFWRVEPVVVESRPAAEGPAVAPVRAFFAALGRHDHAAALALVHPEAEFVAVKREAQARLPLYGTFRGRAGANDFLQGLADAFQTVHFERYALLGDEHTAFAWGTFRHVVRATRNSFASDWAVVCQVRDNLIRFYQFFEDTEALETSFSLR